MRFQVRVLTEEKASFVVSCFTEAGLKEALKELLSGEGSAGHGNEVPPTASDLLCKHS